MKYFIGSIIGICFTGLMFGQNVDIRPYINNGNQLYDSARFRSAATLYKHALILDSTSFDAWFNFASALYNAEKYILASEAFFRAAKLQSDSVLQAETYYGAGNSFVQLQQYQNAMLAYKKALLLNPLDNDARYNYAYAKIKFDEQQKSKNPNETDDSKDKDEKDVPNEYILQIKQQADELVMQYKFVEAAELLKNAGSKDESLYEHFGEYVQYVAEIATIFMNHDNKKQ